MHPNPFYPLVGAITKLSSAESMPKWSLLQSPASTCPHGRDFLIFYHGFDPPLALYDQQQQIAR